MSLTLASEGLAQLECGRSRGDILGLLVQIGAVALATTSTSSPASRSASSASAKNYRMIA
jgi:hypothetical protein